MKYIYKGLTYKINIEPFGKQRFYCVMQNPFNPNYDTKVLYSSTAEILQRKIKRQYVKFEKEK